MHVPGHAMALDNPVARIPGGGWLRSAHRIELGTVVALSVAVVVVAAIWGTTSTQDGARSVGALDEPVQSPVVIPTMTESSGASESAVTVDVVEAEVQAASVGSVAVSSDPAPSAIPTQTGIVPGRPDPSGPSLPHSFERYQVQRGESLFVIATARGVSVSDLVAWNWHLDEDSTLIRGEWIWIPQWQMSTVSDEPGLVIDEGKGGRGGG